MKIAFKSWSFAELIWDLNWTFFLQAFLLCLVAVAYVSCAPYNEQIIGDSVDALNPSGDSEVISKKTLDKAVIIYIAKKILSIFK